MSLSDIDEDEPAIVRGGPAVTAQAAQVVGTVCNDFTTTPPQPPHRARINLDDLFNDNGQMCSSDAPNGAHSVAAPNCVAGGAPSTSTASPHDVLDSLFTASPNPVATTSQQQPAETTAAAMLYVDHTSAAGAAEDAATNLLDLSRPPERQQYKNAESFLKAFERQGRRCPAEEVQHIESLEHLTRNKDDNKIKARLLALMNYYDVLGVSPDATTEEIKRNYKRKALELHPDKAGRAQTADEAELFKIITKAHEVLIDDAQRAAYDAELQAQELDPTLPTTNWLAHLPDNA